MSKERILGNNDMDEGEGGGNEDGNENVQLGPHILMEGCSSNGVHFKRPKVGSLPLGCDISSVSQEEYAEMINSAGQYVSPDMVFTDLVLHNVFSFLGLINLCKAAGVCRKWREASTHNDLWSFLNFEDRNISLQQFEHICSQYPHATQVNIQGSPAIHTLAMQALL